MSQIVATITHQTETRKWQEKKKCQPRLWNEEAERGHLKACIYPHSAGLNKQTSVKGKSKGIVERQMATRDAASPCCHLQQSDEKGVAFLPSRFFRSSH